MRPVSRKKELVRLEKCDCDAIAHGRLRTLPNLT
jgi:hypothetical protein